MVVQLVINGLSASGIYFLVALGFALVWRTGGFVNFSHAALITLGPYFALLCRQFLGLPLWLSLCAAILFCAGTGCVLELVVYRTLRRRSAAPMVLLIASLGVYVVLQNTVSLLFGDQVRSFRIGPSMEGLDILGARLTLMQGVGLLVAVATGLALASFLAATRLGKSLRAVASSPSLALTCGIPTGRVVLAAFAIGSGLAGLAGILVSLDVDMAPTMGLSLLMMGFVVVAVGGLGGTGGLAVSSLIVGLASHLSAAVFRAEWQEVFAFVVLLVILVLKPQRLLPAEPEQ